MGYFNRSTGVHRISLAEFDGSGNHVDIKASRSYGDRLKVENAAVAFHSTGAGKAKTYEPDIDMFGQKMALFETSIVAWSLCPDASETLPMPLTRASFEQLDERLGEWLAEYITGYYEARLVGEDERKNSGAPSNGRYPAELASPLS